ncbi:hypothetical protein NLJ89_g4484 [Agrocybe chaxingu]|uniref:Uncharacterized protein n=1 Tax=Agrocybe chaxingu TaxID=84603 RepID=A0A9W8K2V5_9AGAR|nr:hypothetical protein NLJ89_g4484 [Agrocybe chaxingu]
MSSLSPESSVHADNSGHIQQGCNNNNTYTQNFLTVNIPPGSKRSKFSITQSTSPEGDSYQVDQEVESECESESASSNTTAPDSEIEEPLATPTPLKNASDQVSTTGKSTKIRQSVRWSESKQPEDAIPKRPANLRQQGYEESLYSGWYPATNVQLRDLMGVCKKKKLPLPKSTPKNIFAHLHSLPMDITGTSTAVFLWTVPSLGNSSRGIVVGDVGVFNALGSFEPKFNIFQDFEQNISEGLDPPPDFEKYTVPLEQVQDHDQLDGHQRQDLPVAANWFASSGLSFSSELRKATFKASGSSKSHGCGLHLPDGARRFWLRFGFLPQIKHYVAANAPAWYCYKNTGEDGLPLSRDHDELQNKSLVMVTSLWKAGNWFSVLTKGTISSSVKQLGSISATAQDVLDPTTKQRIYSYNLDSGFMISTGPEEARSGPDRYKDCIGIGGFQIKYRPNFSLMQRIQKVGDQFIDGTSIRSQSTLSSRTSRRSSLFQSLSINPTTH